MTLLVLKNNEKRGNQAQSPGLGSSTMGYENKCQGSKVSFKNLTAALINAAEGPGQSFCSVILQVYQVLPIVSFLHIQTKVAKPLEE